MKIDPKEYLVEDTSEDILNDTKAEVFSCYYDSESNNLYWVTLFNQK